MTITKIGDITVSQDLSAGGAVAVLAKAANTGGIILRTACVYFQTTGVPAQDATHHALWLEGPAGEIVMVIDDVTNGRIPVIAALVVPTGWGVFAKSHIAAGRHAVITYDLVA